MKIYHSDGSPVRWKRGAQKEVLETYVKLHEGKLGMHWLWVVLLQMTHNGLSADDALAEYDYKHVPRGDKTP